MSRKRKVLVGVALSLPVLLLLTVVALCGPMMEVYQRRIDRDPGSDSSRWLQWTTADLCSATWRPDLAATRYRLYYERYTRDERRSQALLRYAQSLEDAGRNADAIDIYRKYLLEYPDLDGKKDAELGINRIQDCKR